MNEQELLQAFAQRRTPAAFAELVKQNLDLVYAAACRQVRDAHLAEDVAQAVFILLAKKAGTVKGPVAGWLVKATYYCCREAQRTARRRAYHERQAMAMRPIPAEEPATEGQAVHSQIDEALLRLRAKDRDAITLRYLRGMSLKEMGALLGIGEEAARKRVDRAIDRLRAVMVRRTGAAPASAVAASLTAGATVVAPPDLAHTIITVAGVGAKGTLASAIAATGGKWWRWAQMKWPAGIAAALFLGGGMSASLMLHRHRPFAPPPVVLASATAPAPAAALPAADPNEDETRVPGEMQLVRWDVLLDASELPALQKRATPLPSSSKLYQAYRCKGADLRRTVREAIDADALIRASDEMEIANDWANHQQLMFFNPPYFQHMDDPSTPVMLLGGSTLRNDSFLRVGPNRVHVKLDHPDFHVSVAELTRNTQWITPPGQALGYEGDMVPGEALVFLGQLPAINGRTLMHVIAWESFQADEQQMDFAPEERDARWWCENGPAQLRRWADAARVWTAGASKQAVTPPNAEIKLEDGKVLRLEALCRPAKWPNCWWDAQGNPVKSQNKYISFPGDPPEGLFAYVTVSGGAPDEHHRRNPSYHFAESGPYEESACQAIEENDDSIDVGVAVGPWMKLATLELNKPQTIDGVRYLIRKPMAFGDTQFLVELSRSGVLKDDLLLPTEADGKVASTYADPTIIFQHNLQPQVKKTQPNFADMPLSKVVRYDLMQRKRTWVSFSHVAMDPKSPPAMSVTADDAQRAEQAAAGRARDAALANVAARRKAWSATKPDRKNVFGTARVLVDAVRAGDAKAVRGLLTASKPEAVQCLDMESQLLIASEATRRALREKLGRNLTDEERLPFGGSAFLFGDLEEELFSQPWSIDKAGFARQDDRPSVMVPDADGKYALSIDDLASLPSPLKHLQAMISLAQRVQQELQKHSTITVPELDAMVRDASPNKNGLSPQ